MIAPEGRKLLRIEARNAAVPIERKPEWIKTRAHMGPEYTALRLKGYIQSAKKPLVQISLNVGKIRKRHFLLAVKHVRVAAISAISILGSRNLSIVMNRDASQSRLKLWDFVMPLSPV